MDRAAAELTLQIIDYLQSDPDAPRPVRQWVFVPGPGRGLATLAEAAEQLSGVETPLVVGALEHAGYVALWRPSAIGEAEWPHIRHTLENQVLGLDEKLAHYGVDDGGVIRFEGWRSHLDVPVPVVRRWFGECAVTWGWTIDRATDATHHARLWVLHNSRRRPPGDACTYAGPSH